VFLLRKANAKDGVLRNRVQFSVCSFTGSPGWLEFFAMATILKRSRSKPRPLKPFGIDELRAGKLREFAEVYLDNLGQINAAIQKLSGLKTALIENPFIPAEDLIRASAVLSDLTTLSVGSATETQLVILRRGKHKVRIPVEVFRKHRVNAEAVIGVGCAMPTDTAHKIFFTKCLPLMESGRLIIRPPRLVMFATAGGYHAIGVEDDSDANTWIIRREEDGFGEIPMKAEPSGGLPVDFVDSLSQKHIV
jgi:hypothetical protein